MKHLKDHGETGFLQEAVSYLRTNRMELSFDPDAVISEVHNHRKIAAAAAGIHVAQRIKAIIIMKADAPVQEQW